MFSFPLIYIAIPFALLFLLWAAYMLFAFIHVMKFGRLNMITYVATVIFLGFSILTCSVAWNQLQKIDWQYEINFQK